MKKARHQLFPQAPRIQKPGMNALDRLPTLWSLRVLYRLQGVKGMWGYPNEITTDGRILNAIGLAELEDKEMGVGAFKRILARKLESVEQQDLRLTGNLDENLKQLGKLVGLSEIDKQLLAFVIILHSDPGLDETADVLGSLVADKAKYVLSVILEISEHDINVALSAESVLSRTGLLRIDRSDQCGLKDKLKLQTGFVDVMLESHSDTMSLLKQYFRQSKTGSLRVEDFSHLAGNYKILHDLIKYARRHREPGVNVLLYGPPGTGKTELARLVARRTGLHNFEVSDTPENENSRHATDRLSAYQLSQCVLENKKGAMLIFDEVESVFESEVMPFFGPVSAGKHRKSWTNRLLEENQVPAIWISNNIEEMDPAYLRRFDFALKLDIPPRNIRERILKQHLQALEVSSSWIYAASEDARISPAMASSAARVVSMLGEGCPLGQENILDNVMGNALQALGYEQPMRKAMTATMGYRIDALNADHDLSTMLSGLNHHPQARLCLYGPPGTGKTALGHHMAEVLNMPLLIKRASDLLDALVGKTEHNIAKMFREANKERAILMLDEADSFLRDRKGARRSWEVTQVNELLTQMESYEGIFICSTNLMNDLDEASIRRFDFKIKLDYLKPGQAWLLFRQALKDMGSSVPRAGSPWQQKLSRLSNLTPGDFALVLRQHRIVADSLTASTLYTALEKESRFKQGDHTKAGIGFTAAL